MEKRYSSANNIFDGDNELNKISNIKEFINNLKNEQLTPFKKKRNVIKNISSERIRPHDIILDALKIGEKIRSKEYLDSKNNLNTLEIIE